ncbi:MAG: UDP-N-acetylglucosamine--N-acetylmuramyl-(pentapeptide) pyrophosphoryl-undecaprenol N-acetylglucosamine transferase, partial [Verrucomicrobiales bacterium]|nr:UDP-N-acetylglucosamine--N-acetylmuramyl-(pentapeptide) pyrophosphoryl-undecaprenol N-acetylglucosamine transferase [Verrucomicrobiales bacterium]
KPPNHAAPETAHVAIACGGTGGHLFPGLAVAERLWEAGLRVTLVVSPKDIDRQALRGDERFDLLTLPAVGLSGGRYLRFAWASLRSYRAAKAAFRESRPGALLSMGGFTSVPPALAVRRSGGVVFLHEANAVPGRANRWLARWAHRGFVYFPEAASRLRMRNVEVMGMPVRRVFRDLDAGACRMALGLRTDRPVLLVMGGSQGAGGINDALLSAAPRIAAGVAGLQILHLTGTADEAKVRAGYAERKIKALVRPFLTEMELGIGAADAAVARAGASSAAELAAVRVPSLLIPYPHAADDHQTANARALERGGAALWMRQSDVVPEVLAGTVVGLLTDAELRARLVAGWQAWDRPDVDQVLADRILAEVLPSRGTGVAAGGHAMSTREATVA